MVSLAIDCRGGVSAAAGAGEDLVDKIDTKEFTFICANRHNLLNNCGFPENSLTLHTEFKDNQYAIAGQL